MAVMNLSMLQELTAKFDAELRAYKSLLYNSSSSQGLTAGIVRNQDELSNQRNSLRRQLGRLRPYFEELRQAWIIGVYGKAWNILDEALMSSTAVSSLMALDALGATLPAILGQLDNYPEGHVFRLKALEGATSDVQLARTICSRLDVSARALRERRKDKTPFVLEDEYDVQDLLRAMLRGYFKYAVSENPVPKFAGARSTRADLTIQELGLLIEAKFVRTPQDQARIEKELAEDVTFYAAWGPLQYLLFVVYNSRDLADRDLLDRFNGPKTIGEKSFGVTVVNI